MAQCTWIQYEPLLSLNPYAGFIHAAVAGDDQKPPPIPGSRRQRAFAYWTPYKGLMVDVTGLLNLIADPNQ